MNSWKQHSFSYSIVSLFLLCVKAIEQPAELDANCKVWNSTEGLLTAKCDVLDTSCFLCVVPKNLPENLQVIDLRPGDLYNGLLLQLNMFQPYPQLKRIFINNFFNYEVRERNYLKETLPQIFVDLTALEHLELSFCNLDDQFVVNLPKQLKILDLSENLYKHLNFEHLAHLEELNVAGNKLIELPKLAVPSSLKVLQLNGNPLQSINLDILASLCQLWYLLLDFPPKSHYVSSDGYCDCVLLKKLAHETGLEGVENVECFNPAGNRNCSESILESARGIHKNCPERGPKPPRPTSAPKIPTKSPRDPRKNDVTSPSKFGIFPYFTIILDAVSLIPLLFHVSVLIFFALLLAVPPFLYAVKRFNLMEYLPARLRPTKLLAVKQKKKTSKKRKSTVRVT